MADCQVVAGSLNERREEDKKRWNEGKGRKYTERHVVLQITLCEHLPTEDSMG